MCECLTYADGARFVDVCCVQGVTQAEGLVAALERALLVHHRDAWKSWSPGAAAADPTLVLKLAEVIAEWYLGRQMAKQLPPSPVEDDGC